MLTPAEPDSLPLFEAHPRLREALPRIALGSWPTPVSAAHNFAKAHDLKALYVKREDLSHPHCAGNKLRGLEFLLGEARRRQARTLISLGPAGSHHLCRTAWHGRKLGMRTVALTVKQPPADYAMRNLSAGLGAGATYIRANYLTLGPRLAWQLLAHRRRTHCGPAFWIPPGGTSPLGCVGHVSAAFELKQQIEDGLLPEPDYLYVAMGSVGTIAGLSLGCKLAGLRTRAVGVVVSFRWYCTPGRWARMSRRTLRLLQRYEPTLPQVAIDPRELTVIGSALGGGYARFTDSSLELARQFRECEDIELDGTYTAKTLEGALRFINDHGLHDKVHLFWHSFHNMPESDAGQQAPPLRDLSRFFHAGTNHD